ncbi:hypothetical protein ABZT49_05450 [Methylobacterium sp. EM32]|uniref:hypothetical protein n=1 Tax=Methylobacterium sp. EM32 TaxID=3163481 RepID=UPI0033B663B0
MGLDVFQSMRATRPGTECDRLEQSFVTNLGGVLRSIGAITAREGLTPVDGASPPRDWDALIAHVRKAASAPGEADTQLRERELRAQTLLRSARKRLDEATALEGQVESRVRAAEARAHAAEARTLAAEDAARAAEARAIVMIEAAEARARQAEEAARSALDWLQRLQQAGPGAGPAMVPPPGLRLRRAA